MKYFQQNKDEKREERISDKTDGNDDRPVQ